MTELTIDNVGLVIMRPDFRPCCDKQHDRIVIAKKDELGGAWPIGVAVRSEHGPVWIIGHTPDGLDSPRFLELGCVPTLQRAAELLVAAENEVRA